jgi:hypothetical protein
MRSKLSDHEVDGGRLYDLGQYIRWCTIHMNSYCTGQFVGIIELALCVIRRHWCEI